MKKVKEVKVQRVNVTTNLFGRYCSYTKEQMIEQMDSAIANLPNNAEDVTFSVGLTYDFGDAEGRAQLNIEYTRPETPEETNARIAIEERWAKQQEEKDLRTFELLKKKYG